MRPIGPEGPKGPAGPRGAPVLNGSVYLNILDERRQKLERDLKVLKRWRTFFYLMLLAGLGLLILSRVK